MSARKTFCEQKKYDIDSCDNPMSCPDYIANGGYCVVNPRSTNNSIENYRNEKIVYAGTLLLERELRELKEKTREEHTTQALFKAIEHYLKCYYIKDYEQ